MSSQDGDASGGGSSSKIGSTCQKDTDCDSNSLCVIRPGDDAATCRLRCSNFADCSHAGLKFNRCCNLSNVLATVCIPESSNTDCN